MTEQERTPYVYYMFHKPSGCVTANRDERHITVMDYMKEVIVPGLHPVGRLDKDTEGLLLFTIRAIGGYVVYLKRISIGNLVLDEGLQPGEFRELSLAEKQLAVH